MQAFFRDMMHPVRCKLFVELYTRKEATAGELARANADIPQATLYRHLNSMEEKGLLKVVRQRKKRALFEKVYAVAFDFAADTEAMVRENRGDIYAALFFQYMMVFMQEFQAYAVRPDIDIAGDGSGFSMGPVYATDQELADVLGQIGALLDTLRSEASPPEAGRKMRTIGLIITPPREVE